MKRFLFPFLAASLVILISCKKKNTASNVSMPGTWTGWWSNGNSSTHNKMTAVFRSDGSVRVLYGYNNDTASAIYKSEGGYTVTDNVLRFHYNEGSYIFIHKATLSANMNGTWGTSPSETDGGLFALSK